MSWFAQPPPPQHAGLLRKCPMSEPTKVKESAHTPGPWLVELSRITAPANGDGEFPDERHTIAKLVGRCFAENPRRIVACVNYCEGVSTLAIEQAPADMNLSRLLHFIDNDVPFENA